METDDVVDLVVGEVDLVHHVILYAYVAIVFRDREVVVDGRYQDGPFDGGQPSAVVGSPSRSCSGCRGARVGVVATRKSAGGPTSNISRAPMSRRMVTLWTIGARTSQLMASPTWVMCIVRSLRVLRAAVASSAPRPQSPSCGRRGPR